MTTIAYSNGHLAGDQKSTVMGRPWGYAPKVGRYPKEPSKRARYLFGVTGDTALCQRFRAWAERGCRGEPPAMSEGELSATAVLYHQSAPGKLVTFEAFEASGLRHRLSPPICRGYEIHAFGNGADFALGALAAVATAEQAVIAAATLDPNHTGFDCRGVPDVVRFDPA